jgi:hypothetical protein
VVSSCTDLRIMSWKSTRPSSSRRSWYLVKTKRCLASHFSSLKKEVDQRRPRAAAKEKKRVARGTIRGTGAGWPWLGR